MVGNFCGNAVALLWISCVELAGFTLGGGRVRLPSYPPQLHSRLATASCLLPETRHLQALKELGVVVVPPVSKRLACGDTGKKKSWTPTF